MVNKILTALMGLLLLSGCKSNTETAMNYGLEARRNLEAGQIPAAKIAIREAISTRDDVVSLHLLSGRIEIAAASPVGAFSAYDNALTLDGSNMEALQGVAQFGLQIGRIREAKNAAQRILVLRPDDPNGLIAMGLIQIIERKTDKAKEISDKLLENAGTFEGGTILKARALFMEGNIEGALGLLNQPAITAKGASEGVSLTLLELYREKGDARAMLNQFAIMRQFRRFDAPLLIDEANLSYKLGQAADARKRAYQASLGPKITEKQIRQLISVLREYDRTPFTDAELTALSKIGTKPMLQQLGRFYLDTDQPEKIPYLLGSWVAPDAQGLRARSAIVSGRLSEGLALANQVLERDVSQCDALIARAEGNLQRDKSAPAIVDLQLAARECPQYVTAFTTIVAAYAKVSDAVGIRRSFDQGVDKNPQDTLIAAGYAEWLIADKKSASAVNITRRLTRDSPALLSAWRLQRDICTKVGDSVCVVEANQGLARAQGILGIDLYPGEKPPNGLFGRLRGS